MIQSSPSPPTFRLPKLVNWHLHVSFFPHEKGVIAICQRSFLTSSRPGKSKGQAIVHVLGHRSLPPPKMVMGVWLPVIIVLFCCLSKFRTSLKQLFLGGSYHSTIDVKFPRFETLRFAKINCYHQLLTSATSPTLLSRYLSRFVGSGKTSFNFKSVSSNNHVYWYGCEAAGCLFWGILS